VPDLAESAVCRLDNILLDTRALTPCQIHADGHISLIEIGSGALQILCLLVDGRG
jgi:hypothetical protein